MDRANLLKDALKCGRNGCSCQRTNGTKGKVHCPAHDDGNPSLSVTEKDGKILVKCHAGCSQDAVIEELRNRELWPDSGRDGPKRSNVDKETRYEICDVEGNVMAVHVRVDTANGKGMWWERPGGIKGLGKLKVSDLPLYGTETLSKLNDGAQVVVTEGEKSADALRSVGIAAVGTATGASDTPGDAALAPLVRLSVRLWADNDDTGRQHMSRIAARLNALGCP